VPRVFEPFGFSEPEHIDPWQRDAYLSKREVGEDVDREGEVEFADPAKVATYIREFDKLKYSIKMRCPRLLQMCHPLTR
jgi:hypothetical protein